MMEVESPPMKQSLQDMDLIDILWKQDIDLGVGREVFDYNQRQKEYELEKQKKIEKELQEQLLKEQEKAFYAQLQLDEETGEFIPIQHAVPLEAPVVTRAVPSSLQNKPVQEQGLTFDECLKMLAEDFTFQFEPPAVSYQPAMVANSQVEASQTFLTPEQHPAAETLQNTVVNGDGMQDMEKAWQELMSIPELQCLSNHIESLVDMSLCPEAMMDPSQNYIFHNPLPEMEKPVPIPTPVFSNDFAGSFATNIPPVNTNLTFNAESFCNDIFTNLLVDPSVTNVPLSDSSPQSLSEPLKESVDITDLSFCNAFNGNNPTEFNDSDSGISINASPCGTSPGQSMASSIYGDAPFGYSDSEMEDMDSTPEGVQQNPTETFPVTYTDDTFFSLSPFVPHDTNFEIEAHDSPLKDLPASPGPSKSPFTKDKHLNRMEARFSRDEQKAKALNIPFSVDKIVNLPVDDFNVLMSKHQFNDAQLALIRDIRRRGKNKVAAQNCRKRKMENIVELESDLAELKNEREKLLAEKGDYSTSLRLLKRQLGTLYMDVFNKLRDEDGKLYSPNEYSLQQTKDGSVFLVPKTKKIEMKKEQI